MTDDKVWTMVCSGCGYEDVFGGKRCARCAAPNKAREDRLLAPPPPVDVPLVPPVVDEESAREAAEMMALLERLYLDLLTDWDLSRYSRDPHRAWLQRSAATIEHHGLTPWMAERCIDVFLQDREGLEKAVSSR